MQSPPSPPQAWDWSASQPSPTIQGHSREERGPGSFLWEEESQWHHPTPCAARQSDNIQWVDPHSFRERQSEDDGFQVFFFFWRGVVSVRNLLENMLKAMNVLPP